MYVYIRSEPGLYTVGYYVPVGNNNPEFVPESDWSNEEECRTQINYLNGGNGLSKRLQIAVMLLQSSITRLTIDQAFALADKLLAYEDEEG